MYKISEFSMITNITTKALRYYEEQGMLIPAKRDVNNYRLYDEKNFEKAILISKLRRLNFSISEIKDVLNHSEDKIDLNYFLKEKIEMIGKNIAKQKKLIEEINEELISSTKREILMTYEIKELTTEPVNIISIRYNGRYDETGIYVGKLFKAAKSNAKGPVFNIYHDCDKKDIADIETCLVVKKKIEAPEVTYKTLKSERALVTTHIGGYETISNAYKAIYDYAQEHNIQIKSPTREIYLKGPGMVFKGNPNKYQTQLIIPIA